MLTIFRRHQKGCPYTSRSERRCNCIICMDWTTPSGKRMWRSMHLRDWQAAQRRARDIEADGLTTAGEAVTIRKATDAFETDTKDIIKDSTLKQYRILFQRLNAFCQQRGYVFLKQLGVVEVREFRQSWTTYSPRTAGKHIERLKRFFSWCQENQWVEHSPAKPLKSPKVGETDVVPFDEKEIDQILKACKEYKGPNRDRLILLTLLMLATGLAIGDASMIAKDRIVKTTSGFSVELRRAKTGTPMSCPIPNDLAKNILALDGVTPFWSGKSDLENVTKNWGKIYTKIFKAAGIAGHPHQFRHTTAKRLLAAGVPIGHVASILGNTEEICRKSYAKWIPERQTAVDDAVRRAWSQTRTA